MIRAALACALVATPLAAQAPAADMAALAGLYNGGQMEIAAGLELRPDGRFRYGLSYGGLDEQAEGQWRVSDGQVLLTSDPVTPPRFVLVGRRDLPAGQLRIALAGPKGMSPQYFDAIVRYADGSTERHQLREEPEPFALDVARRPVDVIVSLQMFDVASAPVPLATGGRDISLRFEPNDLGKVAFAATPLRVERGDLILPRHGRTLRFRRDRD